MKRSLSLTVLASIAIASPAAPLLAAEPPVKVFILAGQSNMEGAGKVEGDPKRNEGKGSLSYLAEHSPEHEHLKKDGEWVVRDDVWISYLDRKGNLAPGFGSRPSAIGPELGFGHVIGDAFDEPVLLIKTAWGGKSLAKDFRPPGAGGKVGPFYKEMMSRIKATLADIGAVFPKLKGRKHEVVGFGWHQGWNDGCSMEMTLAYEENLVHFIRAVRKDLGVEKLPFVIADSGFGGVKQTVDRRLLIRKAQAAPAAMGEFEGNVACVQTETFFRPAEESPSRQGYHWNGNAETYYLIGGSMGESMKRLLEK
jgi:alpha-galactosidase